MMKPLRFMDWCMCAMAFTLVCMFVFFVVFSSYKIYTDHKILRQKIICLNGYKYVGDEFKYGDSKYFQVSQIFEKTSKGLEPVMCSK